MNNQTNKNMQKQLHKEIGAIWLRTSYDGSKKYMSGYVEVNGERIDLVAFPNKFKEENEKQPDYRIFLSERKLARGPQPQVKKPKQPKTKEKEENAQNGEENNGVECNSETLENVEI